MAYKWSFLPSTKFGDIANEWDKFNNSTFNSPILESRFIQPAIEFFGNSNETIAKCTHNNDLVAIGIFKKYRFGCWSTLQPSQAPVGLWLCHSNIDFEPLVQSLAKALPGLCVLIGILQQDCELLPKPTTTLKTGTLKYIETARITLDTDFESYWQGRSKNTKKSIRKQYNRLKEKGLTSRLERIVAQEEVVEAIAQYGMLESMGWKSETDTAIHADNLQGAYYRNILESYCHTGNGVIFKYLIGDQIAAMDLCIANDESIVILKTAYDEEFGEYSPALLMHTEMFEHLFQEKKYKTIEFYGRVMDWHRKWSSEIRDLYHINYYSIGLIKLIKH